MRGDNGQCGFLDAALIEAARAGKELDEGKAALARVIEYEAPNRGGDGKGELIALITTLTDPRTAPAPLLAHAYHERWEHETGDDQLKTHVRARAGRCAPKAQTWSARKY